MRDQSPECNSPNYVSWGDFTMRADGLWVKAKARKEDAEPKEERVCAAFEVLGHFRDPASEGWGRYLRWRDRDGRLHTCHIGDAMLVSDARGVCSMLLAGGLSVTPSKQSVLVAYLAHAVVNARVTLVPRTGWHLINGHSVFVLPNEAIGQTGSETVILDAAAAGPYEARGTLEEWKAGVGTLAADHALAILAISAALAGTLLHLAGQEGGGIHFFGISSKGKTTILQASASVWGRGGSPGYMRAWRATANGLEGAAASASDTALILDELGVVEARDASAAIYGLANGAGKARAARDGSLREPKSWRVLLVSSGELPIEMKISEDRGRRAMAGQLVRVLDIPANRGLGFYVFDSAGPYDDAGKLSDAIKHGSVSAYGTAGPEFVRGLVAEGVDGESVRSMVADFVCSVVPVGADGQSIRAAQRLGLIASAGELATILGVTPWRDGAAKDAARWAFEQWLAGRGGAEPAEVRQAIEAVRSVIAQHGESRFDEVGSDERPVLNRLGWRKGEGAAREYWVLPDPWRKECCAGLDATFVAKTLSERGLLRLPNGRGFQVKVNIGGDHRVNAYVVTAGILDGGDDAP